MDNLKPRAVCLIRNPFSAHVAMTNQGHSKNHTGYAKAATFKERKWQDSVQLQVRYSIHIPYYISNYNYMFPLPCLSKYRVSHLIIHRGFSAWFLGSSPGLWATTAASYCPSRAGELPKQNMTKSHEWWDGKLCTSYVTTAEAMVVIGHQVDAKLGQEILACHVLREPHPSNEAGAGVNGKFLRWAHESWK